MIEDQPGVQPETETSPESIEDRVLNALGVPPEDDEPAEEVESAEPEEEGEIQTDFAEVEFEGATYHLPKEIAESLLREADYRRKTQDVSSERKALELAQSSVMQERKAIEFQESIADDIGNIRLLDARIKEMATTEWEKLSTEDMVRTKHQLDLLKDQKNSLVEDLKARQEKFFSEVEAKQKEVIDGSFKWLQSEIRGWNDDLADEVSRYALTQGYTNEEVSNPFVDARNVRTLWKAMQYDRLVANRGQAKQRASKASPIIAPGPSQTVSKAEAAKRGYRKALKTAKSSGDKAKVIEAELARRFGG